MTKSASSSPTSIFFLKLNYQFSVAIFSYTRDDSNTVSQHVCQHVMPVDCLKLQYLEKSNHIRRDCRQGGCRSDLNPLTFHHAPSIVCCAASRKQNEMRADRRLLA